MRFEIKGDLPKLKKFLDEFISLAKEEYERQMKRDVALPFGLSVPKIPLEMGYLERSDCLVFYNTFTFPSVLKLLRKRIVKKMEENLRGFFSAKGLEAEVKYLGD
jgi:hypothetical protein